MATRERNLARLLSSAGIVTLGRILGSVTTIGERIAIGRFLTPEAYGEVSIALAILSFGSTVALLGFSQGIPRYVSRFDSDRDRRGVWVSGVLVTGVMGLVVTVALYANVGWLATTLFGGADSPRLLSLFVLALPFIIGLNVGVGVIRGLGNTTYKAYTQDLLYPITRISIIVALLSAGYTVVAVGYAYLIAAALAFLVSHLLLHRLLPLVGSFRTHVGEIARFSLPVVVSSFLATLLTRTDTIMLGYFLDSFDVGQYSAAYPIAGGMLIVLSSFGFLYLPLASRLDANAERDEIDHIYKITTKWIYVVTFPAFLTFVAFSPDVIGIFFGRNYAQGGTALAILSVGFFSNALGGRNRETISALGVTEYLLVSNGAAFGLNIVLNLILIPRVGIVGAAVASALSYIGLNAVACGILIVKFDISPFSRWSTRTFLLLPVALLPPAFLVSEYVTLTLLTLLPFLVAVGLASLVLVGVTGCLQPEDRVVVEVVEDLVGVRIPLVRRYLPESGASD